MAELSDTNPNEYNNEKFEAADIRLIEVVQDLWDAGASVEDIENSVNNAIDNVE